MAQSTMLWIVFDASVREKNNCLSLSDVIEEGLALQNNILDALVRNKMCLIILTSSMKQAFLQMHLRKLNRDALRFHWISDIRIRAGRDTKVYSLTA